QRVSIFATWFGGHQVLFVKNAGRDCEVDQMNVAASYAMGEILLGIQDDLYPPQYWDTKVREAFAKAPFTLDQPFTMGFGTGSKHDGECAVAGACTRAFYDRMGYLLHPDYESIGADNELAEKAKREGIFVACPEIVLEHRSPSIETAEPDPIWQKYRRRQDWRRGAMTLERRRAAGFPKESVFYPGEKLEMPPHVALCLPGRSFHTTWVQHLLALYGG